LLSFGQKKEMTEMNYTQFLKKTTEADQACFLSDVDIKVGKNPWVYNSELDSYQKTRVSDDSLFWYLKEFSWPSGEKGQTPTPRTIKNIVFNELIYIDNSHLNIHFENCDFKNGITLTNCTIGNTTDMLSLSFRNCEFSGQAPYFTNCKASSILFDNCIFFNNSGVTFENMDLKGYLVINESKFEDIIALEYPLSLAFINTEANSIRLTNSEFNYSNDSLNYNSILFDGLNVNSLKISNVKLDVFNVSSLKVSDYLRIDSMEVHKIFSIDHFQPPELATGSNFSWENLNNSKLHIVVSKEFDFAREYSILQKMPTYINSLSQTTITKAFYYREMMGIYNSFFQRYKEVGDIKSANATYVEMKDLETRRRKYLYVTVGGSTNYLNYKMNVFLKFFAKYGTSPVRSIQISGWVILIFAFFYFFFYSDWDRINRKFLMSKGDQLMSYFKSEQKLEDLYSDNHKEDLSTFNHFKQNLKDSKAEVPFFFMLFLKPLYWIAVIKHKFNKSLYKRVEFLQGKWVDLTAGKKFLLGTLTFFAILTYGVYLIAIRSLNSLILSINTFTTLGFGDIPVVGVSRYVAILEGFLGWFLLSIFSISLISQILQN
jgi:hypothetical protein